ncbi:hypothetical protein BH18ACT7_BH18ACT7_26230 [soil metagenome]
MSAQGFAVVAHRDQGRWSCDLVPEALTSDLDRCLVQLDPYAGTDGTFAFVNAAGDESFVAIRVEGGRAPRYLLSDAVAAFEWPMARQVLERVVTDPALHPERTWPAGDLDLFVDHGVSAAELRMLLDNIELSADELLGYLAESLGFGPEYAVVVDALPGTLTA